MMRPWSPEEPARQLAYRNLYTRMKRRLDQQDDTIDYLLEQTRQLNERVRVLEYVAKKATP